MLGPALVLVKNSLKGWGWGGSTEVMIALTWLRMSHDNPKKQESTSIDSIESCLYVFNRVMSVGIYKSINANIFAY